MTHCTMDTFHIVKRIFLACAMPFTLPWVPAAGRVRPQPCLAATFAAYPFA
jgi:hypothetical protein